MIESTLLKSLALALQLVIVLTCLEIAPSTFNPVEFADVTSASIQVAALTTCVLSASVMCLVRDARLSLPGKEIQLMHRAPVIDVTVVDSHGSPVHLGSGKTSNGAGHGFASHHSVVIRSVVRYRHVRDLSWVDSAVLK